MEKRLQKILAEIGITSRRKAEELIIQGRVTVNGKTAVLGMKADPARDHIKLDGKLISKPEPRVYLMFNKPRGVVTSLSDPEERPTVRDYLRGVRSCLRMTATLHIPFSIRRGKSRSPILLRLKESREKTKSGNCGRAYGLKTESQRRRR